MATVKGFIRSYGAAVRRAEKERQRRVREATKKYNEQLKQEEIANAGEAVASYNEYIKLIQSFHKNCTEGIDWGKIKNESKPVPPLMGNRFELEARRNLSLFKPTIFDKIGGSYKRKTKSLEDKIVTGREKDLKDFEIAEEQYRIDLNEWELLQNMVSGVERRDPNSYKEILEYFNPFHDIGAIGTNIQFSINEEQIDVDVHINDIEIIPDFKLRQTTKGKLSKKKITKSRFYELYQDHICSSVIRVARELFAYLPLEKARINAIGEVLNSKTGFKESKPILSVVMVPQTINSLNLDFIDPSDSMQNFVHNMKFSKINGFKPVEKVELD